MKEDNEVTYVAVYGTLRQGLGNHRLINKDPICEAVFSNKIMKSLGAFPFVQHTADSNDKIVAEVYALTPEELADCDRLEGHPEWYERQVVAEIEGSLVHGTDKYPLWMYIMPEERYPDAPVVQGGDWRQGGADCN